MNEKIIYIKGVGEIPIIKNKRAKRVKITIKPYDGVKVTIPTNCSFKDAENFIESKTDWMKLNLLKLESIENRTTIFDLHSQFKTRFHQLIIFPVDEETIRIQVANGLISVFYPKALNIREQIIQKAVRQALEHAWRKEAHQFLPVRVEFLAKKFGFHYNQIRIKNNKTRWGSCSFINNINLNLHLMRLPDHLIDYIILHELAHTVEKNHGMKFWELLDRISGNAKSLDREMKNFNLKIF
jgi:predicted metal-dependent hydrolase